MVKFGIHRREDFLKTAEPRLWGPRVAYNLLDIGENPGPELVRLFEDISFSLQTANGTFRTSFPRRFEIVNQHAARWLRELYPPPETALRIEDRAVSHGLTAQEWAVEIFAAYPAAEYEASDLMLDLWEVTCPAGEVFVVEEDGTALQYIRPPFVVPVHHLDAARYPVNQLVGLWGRRRWKKVRLPEDWKKNPAEARAAGYNVRRIPYIHPHAQKLLREDRRFQFRRRSVFEITARPGHVIRTMNILNRAYFGEERLRQAIQAMHQSLEPGGLWVLGRTREEDFSNHVTFLRRSGTGWELLERLGEGSELEPLLRLG